MKRLAIAVAVLVCSMSSAFASEKSVLDDSQMDAVVAGVFDTRINVNWSPVSTFQNADVDLTQVVISAAPVAQAAQANPVNTAVIAIGVRQ